MGASGCPRERLVQLLNNLGIVADLGSKELARQLDEQDPLAFLRKQFYVPTFKTLPDFQAGSIPAEFGEAEDAESIYLCGNSLGLLPKQTESLMQEQFEKWRGMGVFGHFTEPLPWAHCDERCVSGTKKLVGAETDVEIALMNSLTVNIHILFTAFYRPDAKRYKVLLESKAFPSDHYAIESQLSLKGYAPNEAMICLEPREGEETLRTEDIVKCLDEHGETIAIVFFSGVQYYTGQLFEIEKITAAAHAKGCIVGWDLAHAFANVPLQLHNWNVDFACWCTYKYGCSGAGGVGGVYIHSKYAEDLGLRQRMTGWWSHKMETRFQMTNRMELDSGASGFRISNPSFMTAVGLLGFLEVVEMTSMEELRKKSILLTGYLEFLIDEVLPQQDGSPVTCKIITPRDPHARGCQLSLRFNCDIHPIYRELGKMGVAADKRYPNVIRVTPVHLYNSYWDVWRFVECLKTAITRSREQLLIEE